MCEDTVDYYISQVNNSSVWIALASVAKLESGTEGGVGVNG